MNELIQIELINSGDVYLNKRGMLSADAVRSIRLNAAIRQTGFSCIISEDIQEQLQLTVIDNRIIELPNGELVSSNVAGPLTIKLNGKSTTCSAVITPLDTSVSISKAQLDYLTAQTLKLPLKPL